MKKKKVNKYFTGGAVNTTTTSIAQGLGASENQATSIGNYAQLGTGLLTGNPQDVMQGGIGALTGGITNAAKMFKEKDASTKDKIMSVAGAINPLAGFITSGKLNDFENRRQEQASYDNDIVARNKMYGLAMGGQLNEYNNGGTHENNPLGGIPIGNAFDGATNSVEQGETRWEDYIFSDRLKVGNTKNTNLPTNLKGKTFADASKHLNKILKEQPNDQIAKDTVDAQMKSLMRLNDQIRMKKDQQSYIKKYGGDLNQFKVGGDVLQKDSIAESAQFNVGLSENEELNANPYQQQTLNDPKYFNIQDKYAETPADSSAVLGNLMGENSFNTLGEQGYTLGDSGVPKQQSTSGYEGFAGGLTPDDYKNADPEHWNQLFPEGFDNSYENREKFRQSVLEDPNRASQLQGKEGDQGYKMLGADWLNTSQKPGSGEDTQLRGDSGKMSMMQGVNPLVDIPDSDTGLSPAPPQKELPNDDPLKKFTSQNAEWMKYAPLAGAAVSGFMPSPELDQVNPNTMSAGLLKPQQVDEMTMRAGIDSANRANIGAISNATGGSGAAQRAALLGQGTNYMDATSNAFLQANQANMGAKQSADQFNISTQANIAGQNMGALNQAEMYNKEMINQQKQSDFGRKMGAVSDIAGQLGDIGTQNSQSNILNNIFDYDTKGNYQSGRRTPPMDKMQSAQITPLNIPNQPTNLAPFRYGGRLSLK